MPRTGDLARKPGMCPDWETDQQPLGSQAGTQYTEPHHPGQDANLLGFSPKSSKSVISAIVELTV